MSLQNDRERLLDELLAGEGHRDFRRAMLDETMLLARRRRVVRHLRKAMAAAACLAICGALAWLPMRSKSLAPAAPIGGYVGIQTQTVPTVLMISTRAFDTAGMPIAVAGVQVVTTTPFSGGFRSVSDDELLAMLAPLPAALIREGPNAERLLFLNPADELKFQ